MNEINVEKIMEEIRARIPHEEVAEAPRFEDIPVVNGGEEAGGAFVRQELEKSISELSGSWEVSFFRPLSGGVKGLFKRVVRKLIRFCVEPIAQEATAFHKGVLRALQSFRRFVAESTAQNKRRDEEIDELRAQVEQLRTRLAELERRG